MLVGKEEQFLKKSFQEYYSKNSISFPLAIEKREFGIGGFKKKISNRHLSFHSSKEFNEFLQKNVPLFVSYSNAYYEFPSKNLMKEKNFLEADIVYEFDADDIPTKCKEEHDSWHCGKCNAEGKGSVTNCSKCGYAVKVEQWFCKECLEKTKKETLRLLEILQNDFNFSENISINFSGNAGYHIHLEDSSIRRFSQPARLELLNYLTLQELDWRFHGFNVTEKEKILSCPRPSEAKGISKRLMLSLQALLEKASVQKIAGLGAVPVSKVKPIMENKGFLLDSLRNGTLLSLSGRKQTSEKFWNNILSYLIESLSLQVDKQTSIDLHKIVRVPDTLHGGSGLIAKNLSLQELYSFNPLEDAIAFSNKPVKVFINNSPRFYLGNQGFGPFKQVEEELPEFAAVYLIAKGKAVLR